MWIVRRTVHLFAEYFQEELEAGAFTGVDVLINNSGNTLINNFTQRVCTGAGVEDCLIDNAANPILNDSGDRVCVGRPGPVVHRILLNSSGGPLRNNNNDKILRG